MVNHLQMIPKMPLLLQIRSQLQQKIWQLSETRSRSSLENLREFDLTASQSKCDTADNNQCCYCGGHFSFMSHYFYWQHHFIIFQYVSTWGEMSSIRRLSTISHTLSSQILVMSPLTLALSMIRCTPLCLPPTS